MSETPRPEPLADAYQQVSTNVGYAYGTIGADLLVFTDRGPVYHLADHIALADPDPGSLRAQPSRMLDARLRVVDLVGRDEDLQRLAKWRDTPEGVAARWISGPGGSGKSRLAAEFCLMSHAAGWKIVHVTHGGGEVLPSQGSVDLRLDDSVGVLLVVDYADRWPLSHLTWLMSNALLRRPQPARVLLLGRSASAGEPLGAALESHRVRLDLMPLAGDSTSVTREEMFTVARNCFAARYGLAEPADIRSPTDLRAPEFDLVLAVHMAALVAVDAAATGSATPQNLAGLSVYLLNRELRHWTMLYENRLEGLSFHTPPEVMARAVLVASLAGADERSQARALLERFKFEIHPDRLLDDHARCYPPTTPATAIQPLSPDRLAEDFVALSLVGHDYEAYPPDAMAGAIVDALVTRRSGGSVPATAVRTLTVLAAGAMRWPHVGASLNALIGRDPSLALAGGSATLAAVAAVPGLTLSTIYAIDHALPQKRDINLDHGAAALARRIAEQALPVAGSAERYAGLLDTLASRLFNAGHRGEAMSAYIQAIPAWRHLAWMNPSLFGPELARALHGMASYLAAAGQVGQAASVFREALDRLRTLADTDRERHRLDLAMVMGDYASLLARCGAPSEALRLAEEATDHLRAAAQADVPEANYHLAIALSTLGNRLDEAGHPHDALAVSTEAVDRYRAMSDVSEEFTAALTGLSARLNHLDRHAEAAMAAEEALTVLRGLVRGNSRAFEPNLAKVLGQASFAQAALGEDASALAGLREAAEVQERLVQEEPGVHEADLALTMRNLANVLSGAEAMGALRRSIELYRSVVSDNRAGVTLPLAYGLLHLASQLNEPAQQDEKRAALDEATSLLSELNKENPGDFEGPLAHALTFTAQLHRASDNDDRAVAAATEAVELYRRLPDGGADDPLHAWCLVEIVGHIDDVENLSRIEQAVQIYRETRRAAGLTASGTTDMVLALFFLGDELVNADRLDDAVVVAEEAVEVCRRFAQDDDQVRRMLGAALQRLGSLLPHVGRAEDAATICAEAIRLARPPDGADGSSPRLLSIAASAYSAVGRHQEAVDLARAAVERHQEAHSDDDKESAVLLMTLGRVLVAAGRRAEAVNAGRAAVTRRRRLPASDLRRWGTEVLEALEFLHSAQDDFVAVSERRETVREMAEVCRPLALLNPAEFEPRLAGLLVLLGSQLAAEHRRPEAVPLAREAVAILSRLAQEDTEIFEPQLASALTNLGSYLNDAGDDRASLDVAESTVTVYRRLVARDARHEKELATALNNLGAYLAANERVAEGLPHIRQAIVLLRAHASDASSGDMAALATYCYNLSKQLEHVGDAEGAYAALLDSVEYWRVAAVIEPDLYLPMLLGILDETTMAACNLARWTEALRHSEERLRLRRRATSPNQALAFALMAHAAIYESAGQTIDAVPYAEDALQVLQQLNCDDTEGVASVLETTLQFLARHRMAVPDWPGALPLIQQLVDIRRQWVDPANGESLRLFIATLDWLCDTLDELDDEPAASAAAWEQYAAYEALEELEPAVGHTRATAAYRLGRRMKQTARTMEALTLFDSATGPLRQLPRDKGDRQLAVTLKMIDSCLLELNWLAEAHLATHETVTIYRRLAEQDPDENLHELADSLVNHGLRLSYVEQFDAAVEVVNEGIGIFTELHERNPAATLPHLARALYSSAWILNLASQDPIRARTDAAASRRLLLSLGQEELTPYRDFLRGIEELQQDLARPKARSADAATPETS
jgi:tetratricopeptide (TPR) repeat protein